MNAVTRKIKKLAPQHTKSFRELITCLDALRSKGIYNRFYTEWYKRAAASKGAHEELVYSYLYDASGNVDQEAFVEEARDAIKNCQAYILVSRKFYLDSPLQVYVDLTNAATKLKTVFTTALSIAQ